MLSMQNLARSIYGSSKHSPALFWLTLMYVLAKQQTAASKKQNNSDWMRRHTNQPLLCANNIIWTRGTTQNHQLKKPACQMGGASHCCIVTYGFSRPPRNQTLYAASSECVCICRHQDRSRRFRMPNLSQHQLANDTVRCRFRLLFFQHKIDHGSFSCNYYRNHSFQ